MKIGIICPYSFDVPGGVQFHVRDLAAELLRRGHDVKVLAPAGEDTALEPHVTAAGASIAIPYNGSVARLSFGPRARIATRRWLEANDFDLLHIHEPFTPSLGMLALVQTDLPVVATFHTNNERMRALEVAAPVVRGLLERIGARIAVSAEARATLVGHLGGDAVIIPNGVYTGQYAEANPRQPWIGTRQRPTIAFLGRLDESRKGLQVLVGAVGDVLKEHPGAHFYIAGRGDCTAARQQLGEHLKSVTFLGAVSEEDKKSLLASVDLYIAPQTGGESFGIVLVEAMAAGAAVVASNLKAFSDVLGEGKYGILFENESSPALASAICDALSQRENTEQLAASGQRWARRYDWGVVTDAIENVYAVALGSANTTLDTYPPTVAGKIKRFFGGQQ